MSGRAVWPRSCFPFPWKQVPGVLRRPTSLRGVEAMSTYRTPYNLQPSESCDHCGAHSAGFFCQLPPATLKKLEAMSFVTSYPQSAVLFVEGQAPRGVYMICRGEAKLSVVSQDGRTLILKI